MEKGKICIKNKWYCYALNNNRLTLFYDEVDKPFYNPEVFSCEDKINDMFYCAVSLTAGTKFFKQSDINKHKLFKGIAYDIQLTGYFLIPFDLSAKLNVVKHTNFLDKCKRLELYGGILNLSVTQQTKLVDIKAKDLLINIKQSSFSNYKVINMHESGKYITDINMQTKESVLSIDLDKCIGMKKFSDFFEEVRKVICFLNINADISFDKVMLVDCNDIKYQYIEPVRGKKNYRFSFFQNSEKEQIKLMFEKIYENPKIKIDFMRSFDKKNYSLHDCWVLAEQIDALIDKKEIKKDKLMQNNLAEKNFHDMLEKQIDELIKNLEITTSFCLAKSQKDFIKSISQYPVYKAKIKLIIDTYNECSKIYGELFGDDQHEQEKMIKRFCDLRNTIHGNCHIITADDCELIYKLSLATYVFVIRKVVGIEENTMFNTTC